MARQLHPLTDDDLLHIALHLDQTAADLARSLGRPYFTVAKAKQRIQRAGGWSCSLVWVICGECGEPLASPAPPHQRQVHVACERARTARYARERRRGERGTRYTPSTRYVAKWRQEHPDGNRQLREHERQRRRALWDAMTPEEQAAAIASGERGWTKAQEADRRDYALTRDEAEHTREPWSQDEDEYVLGHLDESARDVALYLGRTLWAVRGRRVSLRRRLVQSGVRTK